MRSAWLIGLAALGIEGAAIACSCAMGAINEAGKRRIAADIATRAEAVVEAVQIEDMDIGAMRPELYRVVKVHVGKAPAQFRGERHFSRSEGGLVDVGIDTCDAAPGRDEPRLVVLYRPNATPGPNESDPSFGLSDMCEYLFLTADDGLRLVKQEARKRGRPVSGR
jgi:hypothetical protein